MKVTRELQQQLLWQIADLGYGQSESEDPARFATSFLPVAEHARAFEPGVVLVVGDRGAGKSALFQAVFQNKLLSALARHTASLRLAQLAEGRTEWVPAYPRASDSPDPAGLRSFFASGQASISRGEELWRAYLVRTLADRLGERAPELQPLLDAPAADPARVHQAFLSLGATPVVLLDELDKKLKDEGRFLFVGYDELDTLGGADVGTMAMAIQGLVAFWASYARRWERLRAKLFLRTDLFRRHAGLGGADLAKLAANRAELSWNDRNLYAMLLKRVANTSSELRRYVQDARVQLSEEDPVLGVIPRLHSAEDARPLVERLVGRYMGASEKKGLSFRWMLDHVRDGKGRAAPRALVRLVEQAAQKERDKPRGDPPQLLHPTSLRQALEDVSASHVQQAINNEWPWLYGVRERIRYSGVPIDRALLERSLGVNWDSSWAQGPRTAPPADDESSLLDYLLELGIFRERPRNRIDAPDLFLYGLGLRRKGGVKAK